MRREVWVEFNDLDASGRVTTFADMAEPGIDLRTGKHVVVGDEEGNTASATIVDRRVREGQPDELTLEVDLGTFRSAT